MTSAETKKRRYGGVGMEGLLNPKARATSLGFVLKGASRRLQFCGEYYYDQNGSEWDF
jgi:hypothetical protein